MPALRYRFTNANTKAKTDASPYTRPSRAGDTDPSGPDSDPAPGLGVEPEYEGDDEVEEYHSTDDSHDGSLDKTRPRRSCNQYMQDPLVVKHPKLPQLVQGYLNHGRTQEEISAVLENEHGIKISLRSVQRLRSKHALKTARCNGLTEEEEEMAIQELLIEWAMEQIASGRGLGKPPGTKVIKKRLAAKGIHITRSATMRIKRKLCPYNIDTLLSFGLPSPKPLPPPSLSKSKAKAKKPSRKSTAGRKKAAKVERVNTPEELAFDFCGLGVSDPQPCASTSTASARGATGLGLYTHTSSFLQTAPAPVPASARRRPMNGTITMSHGSQPIKMPIPSHPPHTHTLLHFPATHSQAASPISPLTSVPPPTQHQVMPVTQADNYALNANADAWHPHPHPSRTGRNGRTGRTTGPQLNVNVFAIPQYQHQHVAVPDGHEAMFPVSLQNGRTGAHVQSQGQGQGLVGNPYHMIQAQAQAPAPHAVAQGGHASGQGYTTMDWSSAVYDHAGGNLNHGYMPVSMPMHMGHRYHQHAASDDAFGMARLASGRQGVALGQGQMSQFGWMH